MDNPPVDYPFPSLEDEMEEPEIDRKEKEKYYRLAQYDDCPSRQRIQKTVQRDNDEKGVSKSDGH